MSGSIKDSSVRILLTLLFAFSTLFLHSCEEEENSMTTVSFYVLNGSEVDPLINIDIKLDTLEIADEDFEFYDFHNWKEFTYELEKGEYHLKISSDSVSPKRDTVLNLIHDNYDVLIEYHNRIEKPTSPTDYFYLLVLENGGFAQI